MKRHRSIFKKQDSYLLQLDLPGVNKDNIEISFKKQQLQITSTRNLPELKLIFGKPPNSEQKLTYHIDGEIDQKSITAALSDGILSIILPRKTTTQQITIG